MWQAILEACRQSSSMGSAGVAIVAREFPLLGTVRNTGNANPASRNAILISFAIASSDFLTISRCLSSPQSIDSSFGCVMLFMDGFILVVEVFIMHKSVESHRQDYELIPLSVKVFRLIGVRHHVGRKKALWSRWLKVSTGSN